MVLLPVAGALGVLVVPEIILVLRLGQPSPHELTFPGLAAVVFEAIALALSTPIVGKKKFLVVQALASGLRRFHQFQNKKEPVSETGAKERKKIQPQEEAGLRRRIFGESVEENPTEEDPVLNRPVCIHSISPGQYRRGRQPFLRLSVIKSALVTVDLVFLWYAWFFANLPLAVGSPSPPGALRHAQAAVQVRELYAQRL